jgi:hypothetical protein
MLRGLQHGSAQRINAAELPTGNAVEEFRDRTGLWLLNGAFITGSSSLFLPYRCMISRLCRWFEPCLAYDFKKCVRSFPWLRCWICWGLSVTSDPVTKCGVLARCMARRRRRAEASRPTSRGMFIGAFDADRQGTTSISTQLPPTSRCLQLQLIYVLALE